MDASTTIRGKTLTALGTLTHGGKIIPIFDEIVNPNVAIPVVDGAQTYVIIQDQQSQDSGVQDTCKARLNLNLTIRVVTKWGTIGSKKLCEDIGNSIDSKLRTDRNVSLITDVQTFALSVSRTITETTQSNLAFSKILIYSITI